MSTEGGGSVDAELKQDLDAAGAALEQGAPPKELDLLRRDDDVELSRYVVGDLSTKEEPAVFTADRFYRYSKDTGAWDLMETEHVRLHVHGYAGKKIFMGYKQELDVASGEMKRRVVTKTLKLSSGKVEGVVRCSQTKLFVRDFFSLAAHGIAFRNGFVTVDKKDGVVVQRHSPEHRARIGVDYAYREVGAPKWQRFLDEVFRDDDDREQKKKALQEMVGVCLMGVAPAFQKAFVLWGEQGSNGKSVFVNTIQKLFPEDAVAAVPPQKWSEEYYLARLEGIAINVVSELPEGDIMEATSVKGVITGDKVEARRPRENTFTFRPRAGHVFAANKLPQTNDFTRGFWRRFVVVKFNRSFEMDVARVEQDVLEAELAAELPGIMHWAIEGAARAMRNGSYTAIPSSTQALQEWRNDSDAVAGFVAEACDVEKDGGGAATMVLYRGYREWCQQVGHRHPMTLRRFGERLSLLGHKPLPDAAGRSFRALTLKLGRAGGDDAGAVPEDPRGEEDADLPFL